MSFNQLKLFLRFYTAGNIFSDPELRDLYFLRKYTSQTVFCDRCRNNLLGIKLLTNSTEISTWHWFFHVMIKEEFDLILYCLQGSLWWGWVSQLVWYLTMGRHQLGKSFFMNITTRDHIFLGLSQFQADIHIVSL